MNSPLNLLLNKQEQGFINSLEFKRSHHDVFLDTEVDEPHNYRELISLLFNADQDDTFNLFINSPGGHLTTALAIIEALKNTSATVQAVLVGECHSAASMITMYCHEVAVLDSAHAMIHTAQYGTMGNTNNVKAYTEFTTKQVESLIDTTYAGFLSKDEIAKVKLGVELWFDAPEIRQRMENRHKHLEAMMKKAAKEAKAEVLAAAVVTDKPKQPKGKKSDPEPEQE